MEDFRGIAFPPLELIDSSKNDARQYSHWKTIGICNLMFILFNLLY